MGWQGRFLTVRGSRASGQRFRRTAIEALDARLLTAELPEDVQVVVERHVFGTAAREGGRAGFHRVGAEGAASDAGSGGDEQRRAAGPQRFEVFGRRGV